MSHSQEHDSRHIKSVDQAFQIIDFVEEHEASTLSDIAQELDLPVSTAHIHLDTLVDNEYLLKVDGKYRCSFKFLQKGGQMRDDMPLFQVSKPELDDLQQDTGEHTNLMVEENGYAVQLYKSQGTETIDDDAPVGRFFHPHTTATGKAILAQKATEEVSELIERRGLPPQTDNTITDEAELRDELDSIRDRGFSVNREEHYPGVSAVGVAIESGDGVTGAISVSGPVGRMADDRINNELVPALKTKKNIIELKLRQRGGEDV